MKPPIFKYNKSVENKEIRQEGMHSRLAEMEHRQTRDNHQSYVQPHVSAHRQHMGK